MKHIAEYVTAEVSNVKRFGDVEWAAMVIASDIMRKLNVAERPAAIEAARNVWPEMVDTMLVNFPQYGA